MSSGGILPCGWNSSTTTVRLRDAPSIFPVDRVRVQDEAAAVWTREVDDRVRCLNVLVEKSAFRRKVGEVDRVVRAAGDLCRVRLRAHVGQIHEQLEAATAPVVVPLAWAVLCGLDVRTNVEG